jgi:hypothetical protein
MSYSFRTKSGYFGHCAAQPSGPHQPSSADNSSKQPKTKQQRFEVLKTSELEKFRQLAAVTKKNREKSEKLAMFMKKLVK